MVSETTSEDTTGTASATPYVYTGFSKLEAAFGLFWLALGAIVSLVLEVIYLTAWLSLPGGGAVVFPLSILIAFLFNQVLSKTALLWTKNKIVAAIPIMVWLAGFLAFAVNDGVKGDILVGADVRGSGGQRGDVAAHQVKSVFFPIDIAFLQLHAPRTDGFHFPAFQHQACLNLLFDIIIVEGLAVVRNRHGRSLQNV